MLARVHHRTTGEGKNKAEYGTINVAGREIGYRRYISDMSGKGVEQAIAEAKRFGAKLFVFDGTSIDKRTRVAISSLISNNAAIQW